MVSLSVAESFDLHGVASDQSLNMMFNINFIDEGFFSLNRKIA